MKFVRCRLLDVDCSKETMFLCLEQQVIRIVIFLVLSLLYLPPLVPPLL